MKIEKIGVVGAGTMGSGIAQTCALSGFPVSMQDVSEQVLKKGLGSIEKSLNRLVQKDKLDANSKNQALSRISMSTDLTSVSESDVIIEAATENMEAKISIFSTLSKMCADHTILASNTSSLSVTSLASFAKDPENIIGMHFFNPVPIMKLVEIIRAMQTSNKTYEAIESLTRTLGKEPVSVKDSPGFVVNRMLVPMINEAAFILYEGLANREEIDSAMKLGANHPIGPLALADMIGIDVCLYVMNVLLEEFGDSKFRPCPLLKQMVNAGYLGRKSNRGFFDY